MLQASPPGPPPRKRHARLRELAKFALIANAVGCAIIVLPLALGAAYHVQRTGKLTAGPSVWRMFGVPDTLMMASLLLAAATPPLLILRRRRKDREKDLAPPPPSPLDDLARLEAARAKPAKLDERVKW